MEISLVMSREFRVWPKSADPWALMFCSISCQSDSLISRKKSRSLKSNSEPSRTLDSSKASKVSLELQGGIMSDEESLKFEKNHYFKNAIQLRKFDESAKKENLKIKKIEVYKDLLISKII